MNKEKLKQDLETLEAIRKMLEEIYISLKSIPDTIWENMGQLSKDVENEQTTRT